MLQLSDKAYAKYKALDLTLLAAMFVVDADADGLLFMHNWLSWVSACLGELCYPV